MQEKMSAEASVLAATELHKDLQWINILHCWYNALPAHEADKVACIWDIA